MANPVIKIKRSAVAGKVPTTTSLELGELAINTYDGKVFIQQDQSAVGVASTVITINPWSVGVGSDAYNTYFTAGSVGIGTTNPTSKLHVVGNTRVTGVSTFGTTNTVVVGGATTALVVNDAAHITTVLTAARTIVTANNAAQTPSLSLTGTVYSNPNKNGLFSVGQLAYNDTDLVANFTHNVNSYAQIIFENKNSGTTASTDFIVSNDSGGANSYYGDFGINASGFVGSSVWDDPNGTYLYASAGSLSLGTDDAKDVRIATGSASNSPVTRITVRGTTGNVGIGSTLPSSALDVIGSVKVSSDLTVNGSTLYVNATNNRVGIATTNPTSTLHVVGNALITGIATINNNLVVNGGTLTVDSTNNRVGIATTNPTSTLHVVGNTLVTGVVTATNFVGSGSQLTGIVTSLTAGTGISINQSTGNVTITATGSGSGSQWISNSAGIHTLGNVGIGTTNPSAVVTSANTGVLAAGIVTAYKLYGDGSGITGISAIARVTVSQTAPSSPTAGDLWYHSVQARLFVYYNDGSSAQWVDAAPFNLEQSGGGASVSVGATAPVGPSDGDLWYNSNYGRLFIYYKDGTSDQWVDAAPFNFAGLTTSTYTENSFVATAGQTTFSVTYEVGYVDVFLNGIRLSSSEYTAATGSTVVLNEAAALGDVVDIIEVATNRGPTGPQGAAGETTLAGIGTTSGTSAHFPVFVSGLGNTAPYISTTSNYFSFVPDSGTLSVNQLNVGVTTLGVTTATNLTVQSLNCSGVATATDFNSTSDINLKDNIKVIDDPLAKVLQINGVSFDWKDTGQSSAGVIAQDVERVMPGIIRDNSTGYKSLNYNGLIGLLIEAVKEQNETIEVLKQKINTLEERLG